VPRRSAPPARPRPKTRETAIADQPRVKIDTPRLHGSVALIAAGSTI